MNNSYSAEEFNLYKEQSEKSARYIKKIIGNRHPDTAIILGSGLGGIAEEIVDKIEIPYEELDGFPVSTVKGHEGKLIIGNMNGREILCMKGRVHLYEGYSAGKIAMIIRTLKKVGIEKLIVTNAAGSLDEKMAPGSLMIIDDHINLSGANPLTGPNDENIGPRFPDMTAAYDASLREKLKATADKLGMKMFSGVYIMLAGPNFETPAEIRMMSIIGGNAVGMSTVPEVIAAVHAGIKVVGVSVITNYCAGMVKGKMSHAETLTNADSAGKRLQSIIWNFLPKI